MSASARCVPTGLGCPPCNPPGSWILSQFRVRQCLLCHRKKMDGAARRLTTAPSRALVGQKTKPRSRLDDERGAPFGASGRRLMLPLLGPCLDCWWRSLTSSASSHTGLSVCGSPADATPHHPRPPPTHHPIHSSARQRIASRSAGGVVVNKAPGGWAPQLCPPRSTSMRDRARGLYQSLLIGAACSCVVA